jgi:hypothetical protein
VKVHLSSESESTEEIPLSRLQSSSRLFNQTQFSITRIRQFPTRIQLRNLWTPPNSNFLFCAMKNSSNYSMKTFKPESTCRAQLILDIFMTEFSSKSSSSDGRNRKSSHRALWKFHISICVMSSVIDFPCSHNAKTLFPSDASAYLFASR